MIYRELNPTVNALNVQRLLKSQDTVDMSNGKAVKLSITGRHDPCIVHRALPVIEAAAALACCEVLGI